MNNTKSLNNLWWETKDLYNAYRETGERAFYLLALGYYNEYKELNGKRIHKDIEDIMRRDSVDDMLADVIIEEAQQ